MKKDISEMLKVGLEHMRAAATAWDCTCVECGKLRAWQAERQARERKKREHINLLIEIGCIRARLADRTYLETSSDRAIKASETARLAAAQFKFEAIMVRKLKLNDLDFARTYGIKPKIKREKIKV